MTHGTSQPQPQPTPGAQPKPDGKTADTWAQIRQQWSDPDTRAAFDLDDPATHAPTAVNQ